MDTSSNRAAFRLTWRIVRAFALAGLVTGAISSVFLYFFVGETHYPVVLGFDGLWHFFVLPIVASTVAAFYAYLLSRALRFISVGPLFGSIVAVLSFLTVVFLLSFYVAGRDLLEVFIGFALFGGIFLSWLLVAAGAIVGVILARMP